MGLDSSSTIGPPGTYVDIFWDDNENYCYEIDIEVTNAPEQEAKVLYWGHQYGFMEGKAGYIGLQIVGSQKKAIFSIWDTVKGCPSDTCVRIWEDGWVNRCLINYEWELNKRYRLRVQAHKKEENDDEWWIGTVYDYSIEEETIIGKLLLDSSRGRLKNFYSVTWIEYSGYKDYHSVDVPHSKATFSNPLAIKNQGDRPEKPKRMRVNYGTHEATNSNVQHIDNTTYILEAGNGVERTTPKGDIYRRET